MALRNGTLSSPKAIETAERHREIIELRKQGVGEAEIARRFSISQQAVSKTVLKHVRDLPPKKRLTSGGHISSAWSGCEKQR
jgi:DNA-binding NarL/FixJ family response regulator